MLFKKRRENNVYKRLADGNVCLVEKNRSSILYFPLIRIIYLEVSGIYITAGKDVRVEK